jgi:hypothetical protein
MALIMAQSSGWVMVVLALMIPSLVAGGMPGDSTKDYNSLSWHATPFQPAAPACCISPPSRLPRPESLSLPSPAVPLPCAALQALGLKEFLLPMLNLVPGKRATAAEMLQHPWLRGELPAPRPSSQRRSRESSREERGGQRRGSPSGRDQWSRSPKRSRLVLAHRSGELASCPSGGGMGERERESPRPWVGLVVGCILAGCRVPAFLA